MSFKISEKKKLAIFKKTGGKCAYCGVELEYISTEGYRAWHIEHVVPKNRGGDNTNDNLLASCQLCNGKKHARPLEEYRVIEFYRSSGHGRLGNDLLLDYRKYSLDPVANEITNEIKRMLDAAKIHKFYFEKL